jgi:hypothetical protein
MKLYHISQDSNDDYDTYSDLVVCAASEDAARLIHPSYRGWEIDEYSVGSWCKSPDQVCVVYLGEAAPDREEGIICASYHAG